MNGTSSDYMVNHNPFASGNIPFAGIIAGLMLFVLILSGCHSNEESATVQTGNMPPEVASLLSQSQEALRQGLFDLALALTDSAETIKPGRAEIQFVRGRIYSDLNLLDEAVAAYREVLRISPEYRGANLNLGNLAFRRSDFETALAYYQKEVQIERTSRGLVQMGRTYAAMGNEPYARDVLDEVLKLDPAYAEAHFMMSQLLDRADESDAALTFARRAVELAPGNPDVHYNLGFLLFQSDQFAEAVIELEGVVKTRPWDHAAHYNLGRALSAINRSEDADRHLQMADSLVRIDTDIKNAKLSAEMDPGNPEQWLNIGSLAREAGRLDEAVEAFKVAAHLVPSDMYLQSNVAAVLIMQGEIPEAIQRYRWILSVDPDFIDARISLGTAYALGQDFQRARATWEKVLELDPENVYATQYLAHLSELVSSAK